MSDGPVLDTPRLQLRRWRDSDRPLFARLNADPRVMEHMPALLTRDESDALVNRIEALFAEHRFGLWAVEIRGVTPCAGFVGLSPPRFEAHFTPCIEVGWRLAAEYWGAGIATEAALATMAYGFEVLALDEIVSMTVPANVRSQRVMAKLGMVRDPRDDFDHPRLAEGHPLRRHVLFRLTREQWRAQRGAQTPAATTTPRS